MFRMLAFVLLVITLATPVFAQQETDSTETAELKQRIIALEAEVAALREALAPVIEQARREAAKAQGQRLARQRAAVDRQNHPEDELRKAEELYQVANKQWGKPDAQSAMLEFVERYPDVNRTGCALVYLSKMTKEPEESADYLRRAIKDHSDTYYFDGTQVGPYARYLLGSALHRNGQADEAEVLFEEVRANWPNAIDHRGNFLVDQIPDPQPSIEETD